MRPVLDRPQEVPRTQSQARPETLINNGEITVAAKKTKKKTRSTEKKKTREQVLKDNAWPPGVSGNPKGRPPNPISLTSAIKRIGDMKAPPKFVKELQEDIPELKDDLTFVEAVAARNWLKAIDFKTGDVMAKEIAERIDGKVPFPVTGGDGGPIPISFDFSALTKAQLDVLEKLLALCQKNPER